MTTNSYADTEEADIPFISNNDEKELIEDDDFLLLSGVSLPSVSKTVSEYDMIKELKQFSKDELREKGFSQEDITAISRPLKAKEHYGNVTYTIT